MFAHSYRENSYSILTGGACRYAFIDEPLTGSSATICGGTGSGIGPSLSRERHVYTSRSHHVRVQLLHTNNGVSFLLKFEGKTTYNIKLV